jgi:hypothetical protein
MTAPQDRVTSVGDGRIQTRVKTAGSGPPIATGDRSGDRPAWRMVWVLLALSALAGPPAGAADSRILFARDAPVPRSVQQFAWRAIETRCNFQAYEREQRWFWAYGAAASRAGAAVVYSITVLSARAWETSEPPVRLEMTIVADDGGLRLAALTSWFVGCARPPASRSPGG